MRTGRLTAWLYWLLVVALCVVIYVQSCFPPLELGPRFQFRDKILHAVVYGLLAALFSRACRATWPDRMAAMPLLVTSVVFATVYGLSDEIHQSFVAARQLDVADGVANFVGSLIGAAGAMWAAARRQKG
jgi:VanZ family protein